MILNFLSISVIGLFMLLLTSLVQYEILRWCWNLLPRLRSWPQLRFMVAVAAVFSGHIIAIWLYAFAYYLIEHHTNLGVLISHSTGLHPWQENTGEHLLTVLYFSAATYSSLGLGDIVPTGHLRILAGAEVLNGLCLIGWTVSFTYLAMQKFWSLPHRRK